MLYSDFAVLFVITMTILWVISEVLLVKSVKNAEKDDSIWLAINIILPFIGFIIYKLTHRTVKEQ